jgi:hypothetical protein
MSSVNSSRYRWKTTTHGALSERRSVSSGQDASPGARWSSSRCVGGAVGEYDGWAVGAADSAIDGNAVGAIVGRADGAAVGATVGERECVGTNVGAYVYPTTVGIFVGAAVGAYV